VKGEVRGVRLIELQPLVPTKEPEKYFLKKSQKDEGLTNQKLILER